MHTDGGYLVISLDFELHWGMFDKVRIGEYGDHYRGVVKVLPEMLATFTEHDIHATWATVGMLMADSKHELTRLLPRESLRPRYNDNRISAYHHIDAAHIGDSEKDDPYHFAPSLVREIVRTPGQELASHTFSHYYCVDGANNHPSVFETDLALQSHIMHKFDTHPSSIVFPRNQVTDAAIVSCAKYGITAYRGTEQHRMYQPRRDDRQSFVLRGMRLLDAYVNLSGHNTTPLHHTATAGPHNIPASRFLRPYSRRLRMLEHRRLRRIKDSMTYAAKHNEIFHLWWHPHNFGTHRKENMSNLHDLIAHYNILKETYGMRSRNMREIASAIDATR